MVLHFKTCTHPKKDFNTWFLVSEKKTKALHQHAWLLHPTAFQNLWTRKHFFPHQRFAFEQRDPSRLRRRGSAAQNSAAMTRALRQDRRRIPRQSLRAKVNASPDVKNFWTFSLAAPKPHARKLLKHSSSWKIAAVFSVYSAILIRGHCYSDPEGHVARAVLPDCHQNRAPTVFSQDRLGLERGILSPQGKILNLPRATLGKQVKEI